MKISILGHGTVASGLIEVLKNNKEKRNIEIKHILVRDKEKYKGSEYFDKITTNIEDIFSEDIDILVELIGGLSPALDYVKRALNSKIHVVTANKDLIAEHGNELIEIATSNNVNIKFEASVGGGIPVLKSLIESLEGNSICSINAILNGTTNFILSKMYDSNLSYNVALKQAQDLGFAEANPESDVEGYDAARKLSILSTLAYKKRVYWKDLYLEGITKIDAKDIDYAKQLNCKIKLVGQSKYSQGVLNGFVRPVLVDKDSILSKVDNEFNVVTLDGDSVGEVSFLGKGAGKLATGSAVYSDILDIIDSRSSNVGAFKSKPIPIQKTINGKCSALLRFKNINNEKLIEIISEYIDSFEIVNEDEELAIFVNANCEDEIDKSICKIKEFGYSDEVIKLIKL